VKPNEKIVKSLKGELQIPPNNIPNFMKNIGNVLSPNQSNGQVIKGGDEYNITFAVDTMNGSTSDVDKFSKMFVKEIKRNKGGQL